MSAALRVRRLGINDVELALHAVSELKPDVDPTLVRDHDTMANWLANPAHVLIVANDAHASVGFALGYLLQRLSEPAPMLFFYEIEVHEDARGHGVGTRLVQEMKSVAAQAGARKMWVQTSPDNAAAHALYRSQGGSCGEHPDWIYAWDAQALIQDPG